MKNELIPTLLCDFYKLSHREQYPDNTEVVYSTWIPRSDKLAGKIDKVVFFGLQGFIKEFLIDFFNDNFFHKDQNIIINQYTRYVKNTLGIKNPHTKHIKDLHNLGYLPIKIKALKEGSVVDFGIPLFTIENTDNRFFWLTNYLETLISNNLWKPTTIASIAYKYKTILDKFAYETIGNNDFVKFQGHDFSMRGMSGIEDSYRSNSGHLLSFVGTDTIPSIQYLENYYNANIEKELIGCSVNATEHSVMCAGGANNEYNTYKRLINEIYPSGIISIVSDTWDLWHVLTNILPKLKNDIENREGKVVIRPDSGDPVKIICGDKDAKKGSNEYKGVIQILYEVFGGFINSKKYIELNPKVGAIYGDSITLERCEAICNGLKEKGFASNNIVFGIGSYTYQYNTRDTLGFAMKASSVTINGKQTPIYKDPKTDNSKTKKSLFGRCKVVKYSNNYYVYDEGHNYYHAVKAPIDELKEIFIDGILTKNVRLSEIREALS